MRGGACLFCWNLLRGWGWAVIHVMGVGGERARGLVIVVGSED
jgi:hypothetical protein